MKVFSSVVCILCFQALMVSGFAEAKLIIRGGANTGIGGGTDPLYLFADGTPALFQDINIPSILDFSPTFLSTAAVPFDNRPVIDVNAADRCDPNTCEYQFKIGDPFQLLGYGDLYGAELGVSSKFTWSIFEKSTFQAHSGGFIVEVPGKELFSFEASSTQLVTDSHIDVTLDTLFPNGLSSGEYALALSTSYIAPQGFTFGNFNPNLTVGLNGETFFTWSDIGSEFVFESMRYKLTLVPSPRLFLITSLVFIGLGLRRINCR